MADLEYFSLFQEEYKKTKWALKKAAIGMISTVALSFVFILISGYGKTLGANPTLVTFFEGIAYAMIIAFFGVVICLFYYSPRLHPHGNLIYALSRVYQKAEKIKGVRGPLVERVRKEVIQELVKGINYIRVVIENIKKTTASGDLFSNKELEFWKRTKKSLQYKIYPKIKKGKDINQIQKKLASLIKGLINNNFDEYEVALSEIEKLPEEKVEFPEMKRYRDKAGELYRGLRGLWMRKPVFRFLIFCVGIGTIFYLASFFISISGEYALATTLIVAAALTAVYRRG